MCPVSQNMSTALLLWSLNASKKGKIKGKYSFSLCWSYHGHQVIPDNILKELDEENII